ncbi:hypothetical protein NMY22_g9812 [Coprinellus aureogranulatus]|nr:hypothetical protein NMY22_g9812 [Coprinellus aureogranulatus]
MRRIPECKLEQNSWSRNTNDTTLEKILEYPNSIAMHGPKLRLKIAPKELFPVVSTRFMNERQELRNPLGESFTAQLSGGGATPLGLRFARSYDPGFSFFGRTLNLGNQTIATLVPNLSLTQLLKLILDLNHLVDDGGAHKEGSASPYDSSGPQCATNTGHASPFVEAEAVLAAMARTAGQHSQEEVLEAQASFAEPFQQDHCLGLLEEEYPDQVGGRDQRDAAWRQGAVPGQGGYPVGGEHEEIEELARYSPVPVLNALSSHWHPTQVLADLLTLHEHAYLFEEGGVAPPDDGLTPVFQELRPLTIAYVGDSANVLHDMLVTYPRLGHQLRVASPPNPKYRAPSAVWQRVEELGCDKGIWWGEDPKEAVKGADVVVTDTWISMGQEAEKAERLKAFEGYQVTEQLCREGGANPDWKFLHCLPRKQQEVDDEVFYGPRSLVFPEADNRKWTIMALFDNLFGRWDLNGFQKPQKKEDDD